MFRTTVTLAAIGLGTVSYAAEVPITGNVESKCVIYTDTSGVYGNPTPDKLTTSPVSGGVTPIVRYDVVTADAYVASITYPTAFTTSPNLRDSLNWSGSVEVGQVSEAAMSDYETNKVEYNNTTVYDLKVAGSTWFKVTSEVTYGVGKALPGGTYRANVIAECIAK